MGLVWVKLWKRTEVVQARLPKFAVVQWAARNFAQWCKGQGSYFSKAQWAGLKVG